MLPECLPGGQRADCLASPRTLRAVTFEARPQLHYLSPSDLGCVPQHISPAFAKIQEIVVYSVPLNIRFRGLTRRDGLLLRGPSGWGECAPFWDYDARVSARWLRSALSLATTPLPLAQRDEVPVNVTIPVCDEDEVERRITSHPGCYTAKVKVADNVDDLERDAERVNATSRLLAERYGAKASVRIDANMAWSVSQATRALSVLDEAAEPVGGLQYAEQPVKTVKEMARLRGRTPVPLAADESIRLSEDPLAVLAQDAADVAVLKVAPLGGIRPALDLAARLGLSAVVSSALDTSIGLAAGVIMAAVLPDLPYACGLGTASILAADVVDESLNPTAPTWEGTPGAISVDAASRTHTAPLTSDFDPVSPELVERWVARLAQMSQYTDEPLPAESR